MQRLAPYLGIVTALFLGAFVVALSNIIPVQRAFPHSAQTASSTLSVVPGFSLPVLILPSVEPESNVTTAPLKQETSVPKKTVTPVSQATPVVIPTTVTVPVAAPISTSSQPAPSVAEQNTALDLAASALRAALVNIICYVPVNSSLHSISGSGVFIDSKGIILTNAHIAQYFLLADRGTGCTIRSGSPATDRYNVALIYISPKWLHTNASVITQAEPSGTGEYDFALLAVSKSATTQPLPNSFPFIPLAVTPPNTGTPIIIASYGAQFLGLAQIQSSLFPTVVFGSIKDVFTFKTNTIDVLALGGSPAAQEGSSGGGVADASGNLVGTITTSTVTGDTSTRSVSAITASYIRAEYASEMGSALDLLLAQPTATSITEFAQKMPTLESIITTQLH